MGFIQAFKGAIGGVLADQWLDFLTVPNSLAPTAALFAAVPKGTNANRGSNTKGSENIISNGSKIVVPPGYGLVTLQDGRTTGFIAEAGGYIWNTQDVNAKSIFAGDGIVDTFIKQSFDRFKFGGQPGALHQAYFVNLKELPNNRFGTQSEIYWDDSYMNAQVGAIARGTYTLRIVDPLKFIHNWVPASYLTPNSVPYDFSDPNNSSATQLFSEFVGSLAPAFSRYTNDPDKNHRITRIQSDQLGLAHSLSQIVDENYQWEQDRGIRVEKVSIVSLEYDQNTRELLKDVQAADALGGARNQSFVNQAVARGVQAAGENGGGSGIAMMGMGMGSVGSMVQPVQPHSPVGQSPQSQATDTQSNSADQSQAQPEGGNEDPVAKLSQYKQMLEQGLISEADYEAAKNKVLGL